MKFLCALYHLAPPHLRYLFLSGYSLLREREREEGASSPSPNREVVSSNNMPYTSGLIHTAIEQFQFTELFGGGRISDHFFFQRRDYIISCPSHSSDSELVKPHQCVFKLGLLRLLLDGLLKLRV